MRLLMGIFGSLLLLSGCSNGGTEDTNNQPADPADPPPATQRWYHPPLSVSWHIQLTGPINTTYTVQLYDIDLFDSAKDFIEEFQSTGIKVICYFSAGSYENWRPDAQAFQASDVGHALAGWPGESWLDIRSDNVRRIMQKRLDQAKDKGCDGVDPDNMDGYKNNTGFRLTASDQLNYSRFIAEEAHARGLAVGLKNNLDQVEELVDYFDFAVNEQCFEYRECSALAPFIEKNKPVLNIEYQQQYVDHATLRDLLCNDAINRQFSTLILPLELDDAFRLSCL
ncbi:MAG TPA: endo alpha-1,4 polygalactosaminidase [Gammaproteobacteria bacterium]|nr:endo alpha-1,4 polygalactosaminidase [Gammaproteobacteria bacterium]